MKQSDSLKRYEIVELRHYRNEELNNLIEETFSKEEERAVAQATVRLIKELYPEIAKTLRGSLIHRQEQKINNG